jgi:phage shock protein A
MAQKIINRLKFAIRVALNDLFGEENTLVQEITAPAEPAGDPGEITDLLEEAQSRLDALRVELGSARALQQSCELQRREAETQAQALDQAVDDALRAGDEEAARLHLEKARRWQARAGEIGERYQAAVEVTASLQEAIQEWQGQLDRARQDYENLAHRQRSAASLEEVQAFRRRFRRELASLQEELENRREAVARKEDFLAARDELENLK